MCIKKTCYINIIKIASKALFCNINNVIALKNVFFRFEYYKNNVTTGFGLNHH